MIERQPRHAAVVGLDVEAVIDHAREIAQHRVLRDHDASRKAGAARRVLQISGLLGAAGPQFAVVFGQLVEGGGGSRKGEAHAIGRLPQETQELARCHRRRGIAALQQAAQPGDIGRMAPEIDRRRQGDRHEPRILAGKEEAQEVRIGLGDHGDAGAARHGQRQEAAGELVRLHAERPIGKHRRELAAAGIEVRSRVALGGVIQGIRKAGEIGGPQCDGVHGRRGRRSRSEYRRSIQFDSPRRHRLIRPDTVRGVDALGPNNDLRRKHGGVPHIDQFSRDLLIDGLPRRQTVSLTGCRTKVDRNCGPRVKKTGPAGASL